MPLKDEVSVTEHTTENAMLSSVLLQEPSEVGAIDVGCSRRWSDLALVPLHERLEIGPLEALDELGALLNHGALDIDEHIEAYLIGQLGLDR